MNLFFAVLSLILLSLSAWGKAPKLLEQYLTLNKPVKGEVFVVLPPKELEEYVQKVRKAAAKNPEWFEKFASEAKPNVPLPWHENLGLTKDEYDEYRKLWGTREKRILQEVALRLEQDGEKYLIRVTGRGEKISLLKFDPASGNFQSPNGEMKRIKDIDADAESILGAWKGQEWKFLEKTALGTTKENFAIGKTGDKKPLGLLVYRLQDTSSTGRSIYDNSVVIRFALPKKGK